MAVDQDPNQSKTDHELTQTEANSMWGTTMDSTNFSTLPGGAAKLPMTEEITSAQGANLSAYHTAECMLLAVDSKARLDPRMQPSPD